MARTSSICLPGLTFSEGSTETLWLTTLKRFFGCDILPYSVSQDAGSNRAKNPDDPIDIF
jgi:hypothetical protein